MLVWIEQPVHSKVGRPRSRESFADGHPLFAIGNGSPVVFMTLPRYHDATRRDSDGCSGTYARPGLDAARRPDVAGASRLRVAAPPTVDQERTAAGRDRVRSPS